MTLREEIWMPKSWNIFFLACWIPEFVKTLLVDPESWALESKIQLRESGIPQEEISLPFVTVKR